MNENAAIISGSVTEIASAPLVENEHVMELLSILKDNGRDTSGLIALLDHVKGMEEFVKIAENKIAVIKSQLDEMKEVQDHPIKTALQNTTKALESKAKEIKMHVTELKTNVLEGCKNAVAAFKEKGVVALDKLASFFKIKPGLQVIKNDAVKSVELSNKSIAKIESFSKEYHKAGRGLKNMARIVIGKKPIDAAKESGKLSRVMCAPYKASISINQGIQNQVGKMITALGRLEQSAEEKHAEKGDDKAAKKPTLMERLKVNKALIRQKELDAQKLERSPKAQGLEL